MSVLRQRMKEDMIIRGLAPSTQKAYEKAVERLAMHYNKRPDLLSSRDIQKFLLYLHEKQGLSWGTCNTFVNGLRFFYHTTLGRSETSFHIPCPKPPKKLPVVLSRQEVIEIFAATTSLRDSTLLKTTYSAGLRGHRDDQSEGHRYRQSSHVHPGRARQRPEGSLHPAFKPTLETADG